MTLYTMECVQKHQCSVSVGPMSIWVAASRPGHKGNIYQAGDWTARYRGTDEVIFQSNAEAWMQWWLMRNHLMSPVGGDWSAIAKAKRQDSSLRSE